MLREVASLFGEDTDWPLRQCVAQSLGATGWLLVRMGRPEEALTVCNDFVRRYGEANEGPLREILADVLLNSGTALEALRRPQEALAAYGDVLRRYDRALEAPLRKAVRAARARRKTIIRRRPGGEGNWWQRLWHRGE